MFNFEPRELGPCVSEEERDQILTSLYGGTSDLSGQAANIPESIEQLQMERAQQRAPADSDADAADAADTADAAVVAMALQPNTLSRQGGAQTASIGAPTAVSNGSAVNILATRPKQPSNAPRTVAQTMEGSKDANSRGSGALQSSSGGARKVVHQPRVRKTGKRRVAPVLISPTGPIGGSGERHSKSSFGSGNSMPKRRVEVMSIGGTASLGSSTFSSSSVPATAAKKMRGDDAHSISSSGNGGMVQNGHESFSSSRDGSSSGFRPAVPSSPARPLVVRNHAASAVIATHSGPLVREIGLPPNMLLIEAVPADVAVRAGGGARRQGRAGTCTLTVSGGSGAGDINHTIRWRDELAAATPSALGGNGTSFIAVGCTDGALYTYTLHGRRLMPCVMLGGGGIAVLEASPNRPELLVITADGSLCVWHMEDLGSARQLLKSTIAPLLGGSSTQLCQAMLTSGGVAVVVLTDGSAFGYDDRLGAWLRLGACLSHASRHFLANESLSSSLLTG